MKYRPILLLVTAVGAVTGCLCSSLSEDTMAKAADRLGASIVKGDTHKLWAFVPEDERAYYSFDESKFRAFWTKAIQPELSGIDMFRVEAAGDNGIVVVCESSKKSSLAPKFQLLVSGQMGQYYSPYIVGYSCHRAATLNLEASKMQAHQVFECYAKWFSSQKELLNSIGIKRVRRGPGPEPQTCDELVHHYRELANNSRTSVTSL